MRIIFLLILLLIPLVQADTSFFNNPDDVFVMSSSATSGTTKETTGAITGGATGGDCIYKWNCTNWGECSPDEKQTRNCINIGTCPDAYKSPSTEQNCDYVISENGEKKKIEKVDKEDAEKNLSWLFWIVVGIGIIGIILSKKEGNWKRKIKKEEGTMLIDKSVLDILRENRNDKRTNVK